MEKQLTSKQILDILCNLIALILGESCVKSLTFPKIFKEVIFERVSTELETRKCFERESFRKYYRWTNVFYVKERATGKVSLSFFKSILQVITKFLFRKEHGHWNVILSRLDIILIFSIFVRYYVLCCVTTP